VLAQRNNAAVAEFTAVKKLYDANVGAPPAPPPADGGGKRGRNR
jgi:hypothetical protein